MTNNPLEEKLEELEQPQETTSNENDADEDSSAEVETDEVDEEEVDADEESDEEEADSDYIGELESKAARLEDDNKKLYEQMLRGKADFENFRRRSERDRVEQRKMAAKDLMLQLLDVTDNFDRAMTAVEDTKNPFVIGVQMIQKQFSDVLSQNGVTEIDAVGKPFDPYMHEALAKEVNDDHDDNTVIEVFQRGYTLHGQLLRPSKVKVTERSSTEEWDGESEGIETEV